MNQVLFDRLWFEKLWYNIPNDSLDILYKYKNYIITDIWLVKQPLSQVTEFIVNIITLWNMNKVTKNKEIKLHHIFIFINLTNGNENIYLKYDKQEQIYLTKFISFPFSSDNILKIPYKGNYNLYTLIKKHIIYMGDDYFEYNMSFNNCRHFSIKFLNIINVVPDLFIDFIKLEIEATNYILDILGDNTIITNNLASGVYNIYMFIKKISQIKTDKETKFVYFKT